MKLGAALLLGRISTPVRSAGVAPKLITSIQKFELLAVEISLKASWGGGGRISVEISCMPKAASKLGSAGGVISISSTVLLTGGRKRIPVARMGLPFVAVKSKRGRNDGVKPGCALRYCTVPRVAQPLEGLIELTVSAAGFVATVY